MTNSKTISNRTPRTKTTASELEHTFYWAPSWRSIRKIRKFSRFRWWSCLPVVLCIYVCCVLLLCFYLCIGYWQRRREMCCTRFRWKSIRWLKWIVPDDKLKLNDGNGNNGTSEKLQQRNNQSNSHGFKFASIYFRFDWFRSNRIPDCGARSQEYGESVTRNGGGENGNKLNSNTRQQPE